MGSIHYLNNHLEKFRENKFSITLEDAEGFANYDNLNNPDKKIVKIFMKCFKNKEDFKSLMDKLPNNFDKIYLYKLITGYWIAYTCYYNNEEFIDIVADCLESINENVILLDSPHFCKKVFYYLHPIKIINE